MNVTTRAYFRTLSILHLALAAGQVLFLLIALLLKATGKPLHAGFSEETNRILLYLAPVLAIAGIATGNMIFRRKTEALRTLPPGAAKYNGYRSACIIKAALMEAPVLALVALFMLCSNYIFLGIAAVVIIIFLTQRPTKAAMVRQLQVSYEEQALLDDPDAVLYTDSIRPV